MCLTASRRKPSTPVSPTHCSALSIENVRASGLVKSKSGRYSVNQQRRASSPSQLQPYPHTQSPPEPLSLGQNHGSCSA
jgi:hypothetical protein